MNAENARSRPTAVIAGCGDLGSRVGLDLVARGHRVVGLRRNADRAPAALERQSVDLSREVPELPEETAVVVVVLSPGGRTAEDYRNTLHTGLGHVLDAVEQQVSVPPRVLLVSSTAVYGVTDGSWVDERTPAVPSTSTATVLREVEDLLHARLPGAGVLRLGGLYGRGRGTMVSSVRDGTAVIASEPIYTNRIHRDDAAAALVHLSTRTAAPAPVYLGVDDEPAERGDVLRFIADELGVAQPRTSGEPPARGAGKRCGNGELRSTGFSFVHPTYREGYRGIIHAG